MLVDYFYEGLRLDHKRLVESMCDGFFFTKIGDKAMAYLNKVAKMSKGWEVSQLKDMGVARTQSTPIRGMCHGKYHILSCSIWLLRPKLLNY